MTDVTDQQWLREAFNGIADTAAVDPEADRPVAWHALRRQTRRRSRRRLGAVAAITVVVALVAWPNTHGPLVRTVRPSTLPKLDIVKKIDGAWFEHPIAYDGHDVWLARNQGAVSGPPTVLERRDATTGALLASFEVELRSVDAIAADGAGSLWLTTGGGDTVDPTVVTRVDAQTGHVVFTHSVEPYTCFCSIATGVRSTWIAGGSSDHLLRIDPRTGAVAAAIALPGASYSLAVVGDRVQVGLDASRVAVIDPATNRIERDITLEAPSRPRFGNIVSIEPVLAGPGVWDSWATRSDGYAFSIAGNQRASGRTATLLRPVGVVSATVMGTRLWAVGMDQLLFDSIEGNGKPGYANFDLDARSFGPVISRTRRFVPVPAPSVGLIAIVAAGSTLWLSEYGKSTILVVQT